MPDRKYLNAMVSILMGVSGFVAARLGQHTGFQNRGVSFPLFGGFVSHTASLIVRDHAQEEIGLREFYDFRGGLHHRFVEVAAAFYQTPPICLKSLPQSKWVCADRSSDGASSSSLYCHE
jgi:hypothetical protein